MQALTPDFTKAVCRTAEHSAKFTASELDYSRTSDEYAHLSPAEHARAAEARLRAESIAKDTCFDCPLMLACGEWALRNEVAGVAGGYTEDERKTRRSERNISVAPALTANDLMLTGRGARGQVNDALVARLTAENKDALTIAMIMQCSERTVVRARRRMRDAAAAESTKQTVSTDSPSTAASLETPTPTPLTPSSVTAIESGDLDLTGVPEPVKTTAREKFHPSMQAIFDRLCDGRWYSREDLVRIGALFVTEQEALDCWTATNSVKDKVTGTTTIKASKLDTPMAERIAVGARDKVTNSLSASARNHHRTLRGGPNGDNADLFRIHPKTQAAWLALTSATSLTPTQTVPTVESVSVSA